MRAPGPGRTPRRVIRVPGISCALTRSVITHLPSCIHPEGAQNSWKAYYSVLSRSSTPRTRLSPKSRPPELVEPDIAGQGRDHPCPCAGLPEVAGRVSGVLWKSAATARAIPRAVSSCGLPGRFPADRRAQPRRGGRAVLPGFLRVRRAGEHRPRRLVPCRAPCARHLRGSTRGSRTKFRGRQLAGTPRARASSPELEHSADDPRPRARRNPPQGRPTGRRRDDQSSARLL